MSEVRHLSPEVADLAAWIEQQAERHAYGTFGIAVTLHAGEIRKVERHATETVKPNDGSSNHGRQRR